MATDDTTQAPTDETPEDDARQAETAAEATEEEASEKPADVLRLQAELDRLRKAQAETNRKAVADRKFREEHEKKEQEREDAKLNEGQRLKKHLRAFEAENLALKAEVAQLRGDIQRRDLDRQIEDVAKDYFAEPELAPNLVDRDLITRDEETGKVSGIKEAIERVLRKHPSLSGARRGGGSPAAMKTRRPGSGEVAGAQPGFREEFAATGNYEKM